MSIISTMCKVSPLRRYFIANIDKLYWNEREPWIILSPNPRDVEFPNIVYSDDRLVERLLEIKGKDDGIAVAYRLNKNLQDGNPDIVFIPRTEQTI